MAYSKLKLMAHKLRHWEYWPVYVVYAPTFFLWIGLVIRFRRLHFYRWANPAITNGGLYGVSKKAIYDLLPSGLYPKTALVPQHASAAQIAGIMAEIALDWPIIAKPDNGYRGIMVQKIHSMPDLLAYAQQVQADFLVQELVHYPNELGLFYVRMPNERAGKITGITLKRLLTVTGDGQSTLAQLLAQTPRHALQLGVLQQQFDLQKVLAPGEKACLVPFGNHNRGTEFLDGSHLISERLQAVFDGFLGKIDGFYYGRLDIRYQSWEALERGEQFSIIELNGAMSEPTHIYDPKHRFWYGQKEIFRHQRYFRKIIKQRRCYSRC